MPDWVIEPSPHTAAERDDWKARFDALSEEHERVKAEPNAEANCGRCVAREGAGDLRGRFRAAEADRDRLEKELEEAREEQTA
jgi:hypothetical protein